MDKFVIRKSSSGDSSSSEKTEFAVPLSSHIDDFLYPKKAYKLGEKIIRKSSSSSTSVTTKTTITTSGASSGLVKGHRAIHTKANIVVKSQSSMTSSVVTKENRAPESQAAQKLVRSHEQRLQRKMELEKQRETEIAREIKAREQAACAGGDGNSSRYVEATHLRASDDGDFFEDIMRYHIGANSDAVQDVANTSTSTSSVRSTDAEALKVAMQMRPLDVLSRMDTTYRADADAVEEVVISDNAASEPRMAAPATVSDYFARTEKTDNHADEVEVEAAGDVDEGAGAGYAPGAGTAVESLVALRQQSLLEHLSAIQRSDAPANAAAGVSGLRQMSCFLPKPESLLHPTLAVNHGYSLSASHYSCNGTALVSAELKSDCLLASRLSYASSLQLHSSYSRPTPRPPRLCAAELHQYEELSLALRKSRAPEVGASSATSPPQLPAPAPYDFLTQDEGGGEGLITNHEGLYTASLSPTDYTSPTHRQLCSCPISCIKFDSAGVLFATGNSKGLVCIYDFDECMYMLQTKSHEPVQPVLKMHGNKTIGDIHFNCWGGDEEITATHSFNCDINIYDLRAVSAAASLAARQFVDGHVNSGLSGQVSASAWEHPVSATAVSSVGGSNNSNGNSSNPHHTPPLHLLSMPNGKKSGGHKCVLSMELEVQLPQKHTATGAPLKRLSRTRKCIIAGSTTGYIRMWYVDGTPRSPGLQRQTSAPAAGGTTESSGASTTNTNRRPVPQEVDEFDVIASFSLNPASSVAPVRASSNGNTLLRRSNSMNSFNGALLPKWEVCANPLLCLAGSTQVISDPVVSLQHTAFCPIRGDQGAKVTWYMPNNSDTTSSLSSSEAVVTAFNTAGLISVWDLAKLQSTSFGSTMVPTWLCCMHLWEFPVCDADISARKGAANSNTQGDKLPGIEGVLPMTLRQCLGRNGTKSDVKVVGVTRVGTGSSSLGQRAASGVLQFCVALSDSSTALIDLNLRVVLHCTMAASSFGAGTDTVKPDADAAPAETSAPQVTAMYGGGILRADEDVFSSAGEAQRVCRVPCALLPGTGPTAGIVCMQTGEDSLNVASIAPASAYNFASHVPHSLLRTDPLVGCGRTMAGSGSVGCMLQPPATALRLAGDAHAPTVFNYILPGSVTAIDQCNPFAVRTSTDLRPFLCPHSQHGSDHTRSCTLQLEVEPGGVASYLGFGGTGTSNCMSQSQSVLYPLSVASAPCAAFYTVVSITANCITLNMPVDYEVNNGSPRVYLRTNLGPEAHCGDPAPSSGADGGWGAAGRRLATTRKESSSGDIDLLPDRDQLALPRVLKTFTASCPISYIAAHPSVPVVCVGMQDDTVQFIVPDNAPK